MIPAHPYWHCDECGRDFPPSVRYAWGHVCWRMWRWPSVAFVRLVLKFDMWSSPQLVREIDEGG